MGAQAATDPAVRETALRLHALAIHLLRRVQREDRGLGVSPARLSALSVLVFGGPLSIGRLAKAEQVSAPTMTRLVDSLEREGLARRVVAPTDRRSIRVEATNAGRRLLLRGRDARVERLASLLGSLDPKAVARVAEVVDSLEAMLAEPATRPTMPE